MSPCSRNARPQKVGYKDVRSFLCSRSARPQKGLARRPQSKAPHALAWLSIELAKKGQLDARSRDIPDDLSVAREKQPNG